jgi:hypothetical protein
MECWVISDNDGNVFDVYKTKEAAMCYLINRIAGDDMSDSEKWAAFKEMYDFAIIADDEMSVELSDGIIVYAEKRNAWGFKEN